jgi:aspartate carbamoyltransferase catalytic subunit
LLDIYTLTRSFKDRGGIDNKTVVMVGDLRRGRTVRSLSGLLTNYEGIKIIFVSPPEFRIGSDLKNTLVNAKVRFEETEDLVGSLSVADAVYLTRVQDEYDRQGESRSIDYSPFHLRLEHLSQMKADAIIMHPLPRRKELDPRIDDDPRAKYWRQERNGMWTRAALMTIIFGVDRNILLPDL